MDIVGAAKAMVPAHRANCVGNSGRPTMSRNDLLSDSAGWFTWALIRIIFTKP
jgi:hypothetical protein